MTDVKHPAVFSDAILEYLDGVIGEGVWLDPFCGTGRVLELTRHTREFVGIELEEEWADIANARDLGWVHHGDALALMAEWAVSYDTDDMRFAGIVTSPVYGNRMSDSHNASDPSRRRSYTHTLGRKLTEGSVADAYFWQDRYKTFHLEAWRLARECTRLDGEMWLNVKNFIRNRAVVNVVGWHMKALRQAGWTVLGKEEIATPGFRHGENGELRVETEAVIHARRAS